jgi:hypothetical protein
MATRCDCPGIEGVDETFGKPIDLETTLSAGARFAAEAA